MPLVPEGSLLSLRLRMSPGLFSCTMAPPSVSEDTANGTELECTEEDNLTEREPSYPKRDGGTCDSDDRPSLRSSRGYEVSEPAIYLQWHEWEIPQQDDDPAALRVLLRKRIEEIWFRIRAHRQVRTEEGGPEH